MAKHKLFGDRQVRQLREIQKARLKWENIGIHDEVQELIDRLTSGGVGCPKGQSPFEVQSKVLWDKGWGRELGFKKIDQYRKSLETDGLIVEPPRPAGMPNHLNRLVLWDRRPLLVKKEGTKGRMIERISPVTTCRLCGIAYGGDDDTFIQHEATPEIVVPVRWVWCQDGRMHRHRRPRDCRQSFVRPEVGAEALTGLFAYVQDPAVIGGDDDHVMDLPGSVLRGVPSSCACLGVWGGGSELCWDWDGRAIPQYGSGSRWE